MNKKVKISCIILSCDSDKDKGFSLKHSLKSILEQDIDKNEMEIILVENSTDKKNYSEICTYVDICNRNHSNIIRIINHNKPLSRAGARNLGAECAKNELLVFVDDDTIILDRNAFKKIQNYSVEFDHGYGAKRYWTKSKWFQDNNEILLNSSNEELLQHIFLPDEKHLTRTFIANFGFCSKESFWKVEGFYNFKEYGFEDDAIMFLLYRNVARVKIMDDITVVHVNHEINRDEAPNFELYWKLLMKYNVYWFHVLKLLDGEQNRSVIMEELGTIHFDETILDSYSIYKDKLPLDINSEDRLRVEFWKENYQYNIVEFARKLDLLMESKDVNEFVKQSQADFDNSAAILSIASEKSLVKFSNEGHILRLFKHNRASITEDYNDEKSIIPKSEINQFPCDYESRKRRVDFIKKRYPFVDFLRMGFIGDDDLVSVALSNEKWIWPVIIEKDVDLTNLIKTKNPRAVVYDMDVRDMEKMKNIVEHKISTFLVDPPYTLNGALAFIISGLVITDFKEEREIYVILNSTMMGKSINKLFSILSAANINITEVYPNFSAYKLPENFSERERADKFMKSLNVIENKLQYSSSSNLYVLKTKNPDISYLNQMVDWGKMYEHYE